MISGEQRKPKVSTSKHHQQDVDKAFNYFQQAIFDFKRKRRSSFFIPTEVVFAGKAREALRVIVERMEKFRCETLAMGLTKFYRLAAEFILIPSERQYYPLAHIFSLNNTNFTTEIFQKRIKETMIWIADVVYKPTNSNEVIDFIKEVDRKCKRLNFKNAELKSKNWYCIVAILAYAKKIGWSREQLIKKLNLSYSWRTKNVLPEAVLMDVVNGEMDDLDDDKKKPARKYDFIKNEDYVKEWEKGLG